MEREHRRPKTERLFENSVPWARGSARAEGIHSVTRAHGSSHCSSLSPSGRVSISQTVTGSRLE